MADQTDNLTRSTSNATDAILEQAYFFRRFVWELGIRDHYLLVYLVLASVALVVLLRRPEADLRLLARICGGMLLTSAVLGVALRVQIGWLQ